jgi:hypothetical protein
MLGAVYNWTRCSLLPSGPEHMTYVLRMGRGLELIEDGTLIVRTHGVRLGSASGTV